MKKLESLLLNEMIVRMFCITLVTVNVFNKQGLSVAIAIILLFMWIEFDRQRNERTYKLLVAQNIILTDMIRRLDLGKAKVLLTEKQFKLWNEVFGDD